MHDAIILTSAAFLGVVAVLYVRWASDRFDEARARRERDDPAE